MDCFVGTRLLVVSVKLMHELLCRPHHEKYSTRTIHVGIISASEDARLDSCNQPLTPHLDFTSHHGTSAENHPALILVLHEGQTISVLKVHIENRRVLWVYTAYPAVSRPMIRVVEYVYWRSCRVMASSTDFAF
jgi:hypothetical protein